VIIMKFVSCVACIGAATAFVQQPITSFNSAKLAVQSSSSTQMSSTDMSKSIPFIQRPPALDGSMPGDVGFDPLHMSDTLNLEWVQAAELKHGRVAMLAVVGFIVSQYVHLPADQFAESNPLLAVFRLPLAAHAQIFGFIAFFELLSVSRMGSETGDAWDTLIQDPKGSAGFKKKSAAEQAKLKLNEVKNGRLAMMAIIGLIVQEAIFGTPSLSQVF